MTQDIEDNIPVDESIDIVFRDVIRTPVNSRNSDATFFRLMDLRSIVFYCLGRKHPLYEQIDSAISQLLNGKWPEL